MRRKVGSVKRRSAVGRRKTTTRRRRRISGASSGLMDTIMNGVALGAGAVAARELNTLAVKFVPTLSPLLSGAGQFAVGAILPMFIKGNKFVAGMGNGMMANGFMVVVQSTGLISGTGNRMSYRINGAKGANLRTIAGAQGGNLRTIAGTSPRRVKAMGCV